MFLKLVFVALCISYVTCSEFIPYSPCANQTTFSDNVRMQVSGCQPAGDDTRCPLIRGTNHSVIFHLIPKEDFVNTTDFRVHGVFEKFTVPYGKRVDACDGAVTSDDGTKCTDMGGFLKDREYKHISVFPVSNSYPKIQLHVKFSIYDRRSKKHMLCVLVPVEIMDPETAENEA